MAGMIKQSIITALLALALLAGAGPAAAERLLVMAAASTTGAVTQMAREFAARHQAEVVPSFASSSTLAKQIAQGAPAGVFVSANVKWMDYLAERGLIVKETRRLVAGNRLVLVAPRASPLGPQEVGPGLDLAGLLQGGRLALGDPAHVPAGIYAKEALTSLGLWASVQGSVAAAANVRVALALVERGEAPLGIVYATDAAASPGVKVLGQFPLNSHAPIAYPAAVVAAHDSPLARELVAFMAGPAARAIWAEHGFAEAP